MPLLFREDSSYDLYNIIIADAFSQLPYECPNRQNTQKEEGEREEALQDMSIGMFLLMIKLAVAVGPLAYRCCSHCYIVRDFGQTHCSHGESQGPLSRSV